MKNSFGVLLACIASLFLAVPACAADTAQLNPIGFSADGKIFAFEEFGIQDGSGFGYSSIYFIDTAADEYLPGTPIHVIGKQEMSLGWARHEAQRKASSLVEKYDLMNNPPLVSAYNAVSEAGSDPYSISFHRYPVFPPFGPVYTLSLATKPFPISEECKPYAATNLGFSLEMTKPVGRLIHEDHSVPKSRGCAIAYRLSAIISSNSASAPSIAMIQVSKPGFEGTDQRWIAVPFDAVAQ